MDDFKYINDFYGHHTGDEVLKIIATRIEDCVREKDVVARIGGDEFGILLKPVIDTLIVDQIKIKLQKRVHDPLLVNGVRHRVGMSVGHSVYPDCSNDLNKLLKIADQSMYDAKVKKSTASAKLKQSDKAGTNKGRSNKAA